MSLSRSDIFFCGSRPAWVAAVCAGLSIVLLSGCGPTVQPVTGWVANGEFGQARVVVSENLTQDRANRMYLLDRMRLGILTLADGYAPQAGPVFEDIYEVLRTQGINRDKTVASVVLNEDIKFWKGEPFEQAMAMFYYGIQQAMLGHWDNTRAAAGNSLFKLRDFSEDDSDQHIDTLTIARRAMAYEQAIARGENPNQVHDQEPGSDYLNSGYAVRDSNFTLGYLMAGIANLRLGRPDEARDYFALTGQIDPVLEPLCQALMHGSYNTLLVVSYGIGPVKVGYGPDQALAGFMPMYESDDRPLGVDVDGQPVGAFPIVCDLNTMAADHMWNNLEDVRLAKSSLGTALLIGSVIAHDISRHDNSRSARDVGYGMLLAGLFLKAGAHADTRYCDVLPQRVYVVPVHVETDDDRIGLQVQGHPASRMVLAGLGVPAAGQVQLRYVRLVSPSSEVGQSTQLPWAVSGRIHYSNDITGTTDGPQSPYILGGQCVRAPTYPVLLSYQDGGVMDDTTITQLQELYRAEGISIDTGDYTGPAQLHVLEGGRSLVMPMAGTAGFARLMGQIHGPYQPRTEKLKRHTITIKTVNE